MIMMRNNPDFEGTDTNRNAARISMKGDDIGDVVKEAVLIKNIGTTKLDGCFLAIHRSNLLPEMS